MRRSIEDHAGEYAEALNDIADVLDLPTGYTSVEIVNAVRQEVAGHRASLERLHKAVAERMMPDEPTGENRIELLKAWEEAGKLLESNVVFSDPKEEKL